MIDEVYRHWLDVKPRKMTRREMQLSGEDSASSVGYILDILLIYALLFLLDSKRHSLSISIGTQTRKHPALKLMVLITSDERKHETRVTTVR